MTRPTQPAAAGENAPEPIERAPMARTGRPLSLTPQLAERIVAVVRVGNYLKTAAAYNGVGYSTLLAWQARGRKAQEAIAAGEDIDPGEQPYLEFLELVTQAEAQAQVKAVAFWRKAMSEPGQWRAAMEYLARKAPEQWAPQSTVQVADADSAQRVAAAVDAATASLLHLGDGVGAYDPDEAGVTDGA